MSRPHYVDMETVSGDAHTTGSEDGVYTRTDKSSSSSVMKRPRILSTIGSATSANNGQSSETAERDEAHEEGDSKSSVHNRPEFVQRNKRLFGALMGHLGTAKRKLEEDSSTIDKQTSRQNAVAHKNSVENRRLQQLQREATDAEKSKVND
jgi:pinin/SDK/memA/ protein conserved region